MKAVETKIPGVLLLEPTVFGDSRGYFFESFNTAKFEQLTSCTPNFVQDNQSMSAKEVLRGLHYQLEPMAQGKLVSVVRGSVLDVAVDIRANSPTYGQWVAYELNEHNHLQMWIPPGLAHGFLTLEDHTIFQYKVTEFWSKEHERCIAWDDPTLSIDWGLGDTVPSVSEKDTHGMLFKDLR